MTYVMSYPLALHHQGADCEAVLPSRSEGNFFRQLNASAVPQPLLNAAQQALSHDPALGRAVPGFKKRTVLEDGAFPRDTLHPLISQLQAEENAKYADFHPEVGYLANARRSGPPCASHKPPAFLNAPPPKVAMDGLDGGDDGDEEVEMSATRHRVKVFSKRGDLSTVSGRRFFTEGNVQEPDHYASKIVEFANTQPTSFTSIAAKALANALHVNKSATNTISCSGPSYRMLSADVQTVVTQRGRSGRHQVESVLLAKHPLMQPPPLGADEGVDVAAVDVPHDPFAGRAFKAVNDKKDSIDEKGAPPKDRADTLGPASQLHLWSSFVDAYRGLSEENVEGKGMRVLASGHISFYSGITQGPSVALFLNSKGIRQEDNVKQPTQLSKSSFLDTGVIPSSQFTDLELVPPNAVGIDSDRLAIIFRNYGKDLQEISLEGCTWVSISALSLIATYCPNLRLLNLSRCPQVTDALIASLASSCPNLTAVNLSGTGISHAGLHALLSSTSLEGLFVAGMENLNATCDAAWTELYRHPNLRFFDASFSFHLSDCAIVSLARHCRKLEVLDVSGCSHLTDASIHAVGFSLRHLRVAHIRLCTQFTDGALVTLGQVASGVTDLNLTGLLCVTTAVVDELMARCPLVRRLSLRGCTKVDDETLARLGRRCERLEELDISGCLQVTMAGLMQLIHDVKGLAFVNISNSKFSRAEQRILGAVREACTIVRSEHVPRAVARLHIYRQVDAAKKKPAVDPKKKR